MELPKRKPTRLKPYNYSLAGYYFLTLCADKRKEIFGHVYSGKMRLSNFGSIVNSHLELLNKLYDYVELDYFVIMPNHIHLILINKNTEVNLDRSKMTVSKIIQQFKSACTKEIRGKTKKKIKVWQKSFYDRILRNERELYFIRKYIEKNPCKWELENKLPENLYM